MEKGKLMENEAKKKKGRDKKWGAKISTHTLKLSQSWVSLVKLS